MSIMPHCQWQTMLRNLTVTKPHAPTPQMASPLPNGVRDELTMIAAEMRAAPLYIPPAPRMLAAAYVDRYPRPVDSGQSSSPLQHKRHGAELDGRKLEAAMR